MPKTKSPTVELCGKSYLRIPVKTHIITERDDIADVVAIYSANIIQPKDIIFISEKVVAVTQGRAIPVSQIKIGGLAKLLWRFVRKTSTGIGLRSPESMQCAINECGALRIFFAAIIGGITRVFGIRGVFYRIAGMQAAAIDAAGTSPLQKDTVILGPKNPQIVAKSVSEKIGCPVAIVDVNDIGGSWVMGSHNVENPKLIEGILKDNPLGQGDEQTPFGIIREQ